MHKIKILGAGLSGLTAAINLAKDGYKVEIFEKNKDCGMRFNSDLQGLENWSFKTDIIEDLKSMNLKVNFHCKPYYSTDIYDPELNRKQLKSKRPLFYFVQRGNKKGCIDTELKKQALKQGVKINFNTTIPEKEAEIVASGPKKANGIVKGITFKTKNKDVAKVILDDRLAPKGYAYLLISDSRGTIATVVFRDFKNVHSYFERTKNTFNKLVDLDMKNIKEFGGYGNFSLNGKYEREGRLYVGEAAGLQDFFLGFGMRYALTSGYLAAKSIIEGKDYSKLIKDRFEGQLKTSLVNRFLYERLGNEGYKLFIKKLGSAEKPINLFNKHYNPSFSKKLLYPISRLVFRR